MTEEKFSPPATTVEWIARWDGELYSWVKKPKRKTCIVTAQTAYCAIQTAAMELQVPTEFVTVVPKKSSRATPSKRTGRRKP